MTKAELIEKVEGLEDKVERLNEERNQLLRSNKKMVQLLMELEEVLDHTLDADQLHQQHGSDLDVAESIDIDRINEQAMAVQQRLNELSERNI